MSDKIWCQNSKCADKKNKAQVRGVKGHKYYQSNKASRWYVYWCGMRCREQWWAEHKDTCIRAVGLRLKPVKLAPESAWKKNYNWRSSSDGGCQHYLENILLEEKISITEAQYESLGWENSSDKATTLANSLRAKQSA